MGERLVREHLHLRGDSQILMVSLALDPMSFLQRGFEKVNNRDDEQESAVARQLRRDPSNRRMFVD